MKTLSTMLFATLVISTSVFADPAGKPYMQCGNFVFSTSANDDGWARINGDKPETQKVTFLKQKDDYNNIKMEWIVESSKDGQLYGLEYIKRNGKAFLNAQILQASMDAPRTYGTFDCVKVK